MSDDLFSYLNVSGPEYAYLGHFRASRFLEQGHNDMRSGSDAIDGDVPDFHIHAVNVAAAGMSNNSAPQQQVGTSSSSSSTPKAGAPIDTLFADQGGDWSSG